MVRIEKNELPKEYERAIIEEYYKLYKRRYGFPLSFGTDVRYTSDLSKLRKKDLHNNLLMQAIEAYTSVEDDNTEFLLYGPDDIITTCARILLNDRFLHVIDVLYLNYPTLSEKNSYFKNLIDIANCYGYKLGCDTISCEVDKDDGITFDLLYNMGYELSKEMEMESSKYPTYKKKKKIVTKDEQTRSRK